MQPYNILFIIPSLEGGGAERICSYILNTIDKSKFNVELTLFKPSTNSPYSIPSDVKIRVIPKYSRYSFPNIVHKLSRLIKQNKPDLIVSFLYYANIATTLALKLSRRSIPLILSERAHSRYLRHERFGYAKLTLLRIAYPCASKIICISKAHCQDLENITGINSNRISFIYNGVDLGKVLNEASEPITYPWFSKEPLIFTAVGRLDYQKGFDVLLKAFRLVTNKVPSAHLIIMGEGETRPNLEGLSKKLDSEKNVIFPGFLNNPFKLMANSTAFVLSSRYEGFPNVLIEAMALGLPVISTDCPTGPREILGDGEYGLLVENEDSQALAKAMLKVALDMELRKRLSYQSSKRVKDFSHIEMVRKYEQSFIETIQEFEK